MKVRSRLASVCLFSALVIVPTPRGAGSPAPKAPVHAPRKGVESYQAQSSVAAKGEFATVSAADFASMNWVVVASVYSDES